MRPQSRECCRTEWTHARTETPVSLRTTRAAHTTTHGQLHCNGPTVLMVQCRDIHQSYTCES